MKLFKLMNRKLFNKFLSFYSLVIILPLLVLGYANYYISTKIIEEKNEKIYNSILLKTQNSIQTKLNSFDSLTGALLNNRRIQKVLYEPLQKDLSEAASSFEYYLAISELKHTVFYHDYIESAALYLESSKTILHVDGLYSSSDFLSSIFLKSGLDFDMLLSGCTPISQNLFYALPHSISLNNRQPDVITIIKTFSDGGNKIDGAFLLFVNTALFDELVPSSIQYTGVSSLLLDESGNLVSGNPYIHKIKSELNFSETMEVEKNVRLDNTAYNIFYKNLDNLPWKLAVYAPSSSAIYFYGYTKWFFTILSIFMFLGLFLSLAISYRSYKPVNQMIYAIKSEYKQTGTVADEYSFIENAIANMHQTLGELNESAERYKTSLKKLYLLRLSIDADINKSEISEIMDFLTLNQKNTLFLVCVLAPGILSGFENIDVNGVLYSIKVGSQNFEIYPLETSDGTHIVLFSWNSSSNSEAELQIPYLEILKLLGEASRIYRDKNSQELFIGTGSIAEHAGNISRSYKEALSSLEFAKLFNKRDIIIYGDISEKPFEAFYYPFELEANLLRSLKNGDYSGIHQALESIKVENLHKRALDLTSARCLFYKLHSTFIKGAGLLNRQLESIDGTPDIFSIEGLILHIDTVFKQLCPTVKAVDDTTMRIREYIDLNYLNPSLSLAHISEEFGVSTYYISRIFQNDTEAGFLDFINTRKVEFAANLLKSTNYPLAQISETSGFSNLYTFIRVFKRYKGTTPGNFRQAKKPH